jgi:hypothetical protein
VRNETVFRKEDENEGNRENGICVLISIGCLCGRKVEKLDEIRITNTNTKYEELSEYIQLVFSG